LAVPASIDIEALEHRYADGTVALDGIDLRIEAGERFGIIGPSGAGKSTLLMHLNGLLTGEGVVKIGGRPITKDSLASIRRRVGLVFQNPDDQLFNPTVEDDVAFGPLNLGCTPEETRRRVSESLAQMRLEGFEPKSSHHLSYGERKRVALATVLAMRPGVVALDEPFANLDPGMVRELVGMLCELRATVVVVSQQILPAVVCCDRLAIVDAGRVVAIDDTRSIASDRALMKRVGLDVGFTCDVCSDLFS
jgi:energy-coupling factor transporter ATP-binding protein EcfA2